MSKKIVELIGFHVGDASLRVDHDDARHAPIERVHRPANAELVGMATQTRSSMALNAFVAVTADRFSRIGRRLGRSARARAQEDTGEDPPHRRHYATLVLWLRDFMKPRRLAQRTSMMRLCAFSLALCATASCYVGGGGTTRDIPCMQIPIPDGKPIHVSGVVVEPDGVTPVPNAMIAIEYGGLYLEWCSLDQASPFYMFGTVADANGKFEVDVREGMLGFHSFASGYYYSRAPLDTSTGATSVTLMMGKLPAGQMVPAIANAAFAASTVAPGGSVTFSATLATWSPNDPLSDENVLVEPTGSLGIELNPPVLGQRDNFADGLWKRTFTAPSVPGMYTYSFSATTAGCITSNVVTATLTVQ